MKEKVLFLHAPRVDFIGGIRSKKFSPTFLDRQAGFAQIDSQATREIKEVYTLLPRVCNCT